MLRNGRKLEGIVLTETNPSKRPNTIWFHVAQSATLTRQKIDGWRLVAGGKNMELLFNRYNRVSTVGMEIVAGGV